MPAPACFSYPSPLRIGLSATQNPIELVAQFLGGARGDEVEIVQAGRRRSLDLAIEVPTDELGSVATMSIWESVYTRIAELALEHRSTLVFVNSASMAERLRLQLGERLGVGKRGMPPWQPLAQTATQCRTSP